jgi:hypothetical protein
MPKKNYEAVISRRIKSDAIAQLILNDNVFN